MGRRNMLDRRIDSTAVKNITLVLVFALLLVPFTVFAVHGAGFTKSMAQSIPPRIGIFLPCLKMGLFISK